MQNFITISNNDKLQSLIGILNDVSPFIVKNLYAHLKNVKPAIWSAYCHDQDESAAAYMLEMLKDSMQFCLSQSVINEVDSRLSLAMEYQAQAVYNQLDIEEQQDQDLFWDRADAQSAFDDRLAMYANEY
ncbi:hypothetical protein GECvBMG_gp217c [Salmonella phage GEC_vB_MG]|uniref:Uncharacterized protein 184 n=2 Tax=Seunavirus TaxID=1914851 RepID=G3BM50_9CAUD|nr:hypothetical protein PVP-SE1_gp184 [Salmonella phage PVPSE1]YP_009148935.1 hypothetical protein ACQ19_gp139 [Salmonella phage SSE121]ADP02580.1 hypothetical protein [Salmonella phage PVPSE1]AFU63780.1 hypothetical protein [Salmonella phage SSE121]QPI14761.1 hypothetical protein GECvBMG_gp217c [Salmonella phage GEC_vB_MG]